MACDGDDEDCHDDDHGHDQEMTMTSRRIVIGAMCDDRKI